MRVILSSLTGRSVAHPIEYVEKAHCCPPLSPERQTQVKQHCSAAPWAMRFCTAEAAFSSPGFPTLAASAA